MTRSFTLLDGGMGKLLLARGAPFRQPEWSALALMEGPETVVAAHEEFIAAGADVIITNNYAVVPYHLGAAGFEERVEELAGLAGRLAREAADGADRPVRVAGSIPPLFGSYEPDAFDPVAAPEPLRRIAAALAPHVDVFLAETQSVLAEVRASAEAAAPHGKPLWLSVTLVDRVVDGRSVLRSGESVTEAAAVVAEVGADALLFNCSEPEVMEAAIVEARAALPGGVQIGAYANAFEPKEDEYAANGVILDHRPELNDGGYTTFVEQWLAAGAEIVGGCCGIMPEHIALLHALR
jgi:S-methylmethionine-dependent homocysteine/selenocysteine methylase